MFNDTFVGGFLILSICYCFAINNKHPFFGEGNITYVAGNL